MKEMSTFVSNRVKCQKNKNPAITSHMYYNTVFDRRKKKILPTAFQPDMSIAQTEQRNKVVVFDR